MARPKLVVFDLDFTCWPYWLFDGKSVTDAEEQSVSVYKLKTKFYKEVPGVLKELKEKNYTLAAASRVARGDVALDWMKFVKVLKYFTYVVVLPDPKSVHFHTLRAQSGVEFRDMLFFDDQENNIIEVGQLGVVTEQVEGGMSFVHLHKGLDTYAARHKMST